MEKDSKAIMEKSYSEIRLKKTGIHTILENVEEKQKL